MFIFVGTTFSPNLLRPTVVVVVEKVRTAGGPTAISDGKTLTARLIVRITDAVDPGSESLPAVEDTSDERDDTTTTMNITDEVDTFSDPGINYLFF